MRQAPVIALVAAALLAACSEQPAVAPTPELNEALREAAFVGRPEAVQRLLDQGADPNNQDAEGRTALMLAAYQGNAEAVDLLLNGGSDPNVRDGAGRGALFYGASGPFPGLVRSLVEHGADLDARGGEEGWTPLMIAAAEGHADNVLALVAAGADPAVVDDDGETARAFAAQAGHAAVVEILEETGGR